MCNLCYFDHKLDGLPRLFDIPQDMAESQNEARAKAEAEAYFIFPNDSAQNVAKERGGDREAKVEPKKGKTEPKPNPQPKLKQGKAHIKCEIYVWLSFVFTQIVHRLYRIMTSACLSIGAGQWLRQRWREGGRGSECFVLIAVQRPG